MGRAAIPVTSARVDMAVDNNATWQDAFQFGDAADTSWTLVGQHFRLDVKTNKDDASPLITLSDVNGRIVVDDTDQRIIHFNVDDVTLRSVLLPGEYVYDLIMYDESDPPVRTKLMRGHVVVKQGVSGDDV